MKYPQLEVQPISFFAVGSPIGMFLTVRGLEAVGEDYMLPKCPSFFNIFHPVRVTSYLYLLLLLLFLIIYFFLLTFSHGNLCFFWMLVLPLLSSQCSSSFYGHITKTYYTIIFCKFSSSSVFKFVSLFMLNIQFSLFAFCLDNHILQCFILQCFIGQCFNHFYKEHRACVLLLSIQDFVLVILNPFNVCYFLVHSS